MSIHIYVCVFINDVKGKLDGRYQGYLFYEHKGLLLVYGVEML